MEVWGQVCSGIATLALLVGSGSAYATLRLDQERAHKLKDLLGWGWRAGALVGVGALLLGLILRGMAAGTRSSSSGWLPFSSVADRAALVALVAGLFTVGPGLRSLVRPGQRPRGWAGMVPLAIVAGISALGWPVESSPAPLLLACTLIVAGFGLWAAGQGLDALTKDQEANRWATAVVFVGVTVNVVVVAGVNWRVWGTPGGTAVASPGGFLSLLAVWLISAAGLILGQNSVRLTRALDLLVAALLLGLALSVRWTLPFS